MVIQRYPRVNSQQTLLRWRTGMWRRLWRNFLARVRGISYLRGTGGGKVTQKQVRESLLEQLRLQNKTSEFYGDLVNDYVKYWSLKNKLITDINKKGLRYKTVNGNGIEVEKPNESVTNLPKITTAMLKILNDLNLKEPLSESSAEDDYL